MLINPYDTSIGQHINTTKLIKTLNEFIVNVENVGYLSYEFNSVNDVKLCFITGKDDLEKELPVWNHPLYFKDFKGVERIFIDVRSFVKNVDKDTVDLSGNVSNGMGFETLLIRATYMMFTAGEDEGQIGNIKTSLAIMFSKWISTAFKANLTLGVEDVVKLEIVALYYIFNILDDEEYDERSVENIYVKITKHSRHVRGNIRYVEKVCSQIELNPKTPVDLVEAIKIGANSPMLDTIDTNALYNIIGNTWNGINASEVLIMAFEHVPTLIAIMFTSGSSKSFKHSKLANILTTNKREIKLDEFIKNIENTLKENIQ